MRIQGRISLCIVLLAVSAFGQSITGTITGVVEDPTGARVSGAAISALNQDTNVRYPASTTGAGLYTIPDLPLGKYTITAEATGFKKSVRTDLQVGAADRLRVDLRLELGGTSETVIVSSAAPLVESERATIGGSFT